MWIFCHISAGALLGLFLKMKKTEWRLLEDFRSTLSCLIRPSNATLAAWAISLILMLLLIFLFTVQFVARNLHLLPPLLETGMLISNRSWTLLHILCLLAVLPVLFPKVAGYYLLS